MNRWRESTLEEICEIEIGRTPARGNKAFWDKKKTSSNVWLSIADLLNGEGKIVSDSKEYVSDKGALLCKTVKEGTLLVSFKLTLGRLAFAGRDLFTNEAIAALVVKDENKILKGYLYYYLTFFDWNEATKGDIKVKGKTLNKAKLKKISVYFPTSIDEQVQIVTALDSIFEKAEKAKEIAKKNLQNTREFFEAYLQNIFDDSNSRWGKKTLKQISITYGRGKSKNRPRNDPKLFDGKYPFVQTGDIRNSVHHITTYKQTYNEVGLAQSRLWPKGTICITIAANIAETGILGFDACFPDSIIGLVVNPKIVDTDFIEYLLQSFKVYLQKKGKGSAQDNINLATFENEFFPIPSLIEQQAIVKKLNMLAFETKRLENTYQQKLKNLEELKKSILQKAFEGEL